MAQIELRVRLNTDALLPVLERLKAANATLPPEVKQSLGAQMPDQLFVARDEARWVDDVLELPVEPSPKLLAFVARVESAAAGVA